MKRKLFVTLLTLLCALCCAFPFAACGNNDGNDNNDDSVDADANVEVTEEKWQTEISKFKDLDGLKNYTVDTTIEYDGSDDYSFRAHIDRENGRLYMPDNTPSSPEDDTFYLIYCETGKSFELEGYSYESNDDSPEPVTYTVCNYRELVYSQNGFNLEKTENLDYGDAEKMFMFECGLTMLQNIKYNDEIIKLEDAYDKFTYNEETKTYSATVDLLWEYAWSVKHYNIGIPGTLYGRFDIDEYYLTCDVEIFFNKDSFTMKIDCEYENEHQTMTLKIYDFNTTEINLSEEVAAALAE